MIRFVVALGKVNGKGRKVLVAGDQNHVKGDLSAEELFETVLKYNRKKKKGQKKGIKVKFVEPEYLLESIKLLNKYYRHVSHKFPLLSLVKT